MIKRLLKICAVFLTFFTGLTGLYLGNLFFMKPVSIDHYLGKEIVVSLVDSPELLTYLGVFDKFSHITKHNSKLTIPNPKDLESDISQTEDRLAILKSYKTDSLSDEQKVTKKIAIFDTENNLKRIKRISLSQLPLKSGSWGTSECYKFYE